MKIRSLLLGVAVSLSATHCATAQSNPLAENLASSVQLVSGQAGDAEIAETDNPFAFLSDAPEGLSSPSDIKLSDPEPASRPVSANNPASIIEPIVDLSTLDGMQHASVDPIQWGGQHTESPIGRILMRKHCNARALWANYPAERAAECAAMWSHLNKQNSCVRCSQGCDSLGSTRVRNRYRSRPATSCDQGGCDTVGCSSCQNLASQTTPQQNHQFTQTVTDPTRKLPIVELPLPPLPATTQAAHQPAFARPIVPQRAASTPHYTTVSARLPLHR